jgi:glycoprotein endo-alpha-1,2-mannosidase
LSGLRSGFVLVLLSATAVLAAGSAPAALPPPDLEAGNVAIFYYAWYGTPDRDGGWQHWDQNGNAPPTGIASDYYPARGPYSSSDEKVVRSQMLEIADAGIQTVIVSWWGPRSAEDVRLPQTIAAARRAGLLVAVHVEPYSGRTPASVAADVARLRQLGVTAYYVYDSSASPDREWKAANRPLRGVQIYANTGLPGKADAGGFTGLYTYDILVFDGTSFPRMCAAARRLKLLCAPSVGPGFSAWRATGDARDRPRQDGDTYDKMWRHAVRARADQVTITSYNEWHEGTQIEPAGNVGKRYDSYSGAWGETGEDAERSYLERTAMWAERFAARLAATR